MHILDAAASEHLRTVSYCSGNSSLSQYQMQRLVIWQPLKSTRDLLNKSQINICDLSFQIFLMFIPQILLYSPDQVVGVAKCLCYWILLLFIFQLDISPTAGDFLRDPMVTNEDKYWSQYWKMLQFEQLFRHPPPLFSIPGRYYPSENPIKGY